MLDFNFPNMNVFILNTFICWHKLLNNIIKINTNGLISKDWFGCGGILRDHSGNMIVAFASNPY